MRVGSPSVNDVNRRRKQVHGETHVKVKTRQGLDSRGHNPRKIEDCWEPPEQEHAREAVP